MSDPARGPSVTRTTCCYCGVGCGIVVSKDRAGHLTLAGDTEHPTNRGLLCSKGKALLHAIADRSDRLHWPQMRASRALPLRRASWEDSLARAANEFKRIQAAHGRDSVAFYVSGQCLTEEYAIANKLVKGFLGTNNIDTNSRLCMSSAVAGYKQTLGADGPPISYDDIESCDTFLIAGANPAWCHPILFRRMEARKATDPAAVRMVVIDPRRTASAAVADLHLQIKPGTDVALFHALARQLDQIGAVDHAYIAAHCSGWDALRAAVEPWTLARAAQHCGLAADDIARCADWLAGDRRFLSLWTMGLNQSAVGTDKNTSLINLSLITGKIGKPGCGPFSLTGQPNAMGGREVGGLANLLPAHRDLADPAQRAEVARQWNAPADAIAATPGLTAVEMFAAARAGRVKAIWVVCTNPVASLPDAWQVEAALRACELVVVQDIHATDTTPFADIVLPAATWLEKTGTMTNSERRITLLEPAIAPPGEALPDTEIIRRFAVAMGWGRDFAYADEEAVYREHVGLTAGTDCDISGVDYARLRNERSLQWPVPSSDHPGTPRLYADGQFATPDGRARLRAPAVEDRSEPLDADYPLVLTTGRVRDQWHTMTRTGRVAKLRAHADAPFCEIHPDDAFPRGIVDGDIVEVRGRRGAVRVRATVTADIRSGVAFLPMHWGKRLGGEHGRANNLTSPRLDPVSKEPDLKYAAVEIARHRPPARRIVVIGAGAGALGFVEAHCARTHDDIIDIFGDEPLPIYDRVLLPHFIDHTKTWDDLIRATPEQLLERGVRFHPGVRIVAIDRVARTVTDAMGGVHPYDVLIIATGSRANLPTVGPLAKPGVFGLRSRFDAERLRENVLAVRARTGRQPRVAILGAGLLGIEVADSLATIGCAVTIIQRSNRVMGKQLDARASTYLLTHLEDRGIQVRLDADLLSLTGETRVTGAKISDGETVPCDVFVVATGTQPNVELARAIGLACGKGVIVDQHLRTSDPHIHAIGEVAEHEGKLYGTTATSVEHARHVAEFMRGNVHAPYRGSVTANILKVRGVPLASCGLVDPGNDPEYETVVFEDPRRRLYCKAVVKADRLVGVLMLGHTVGFAEHRDLIASGMELDELRDRLLRLGGEGGGGPKGKLVCSCNQVGEDDIAAAIAGGANDVATICAKTRAGTSCGSCRPEVAKLLGRCPVVAPSVPTPTPMPMPMPIPVAAGV